MADDEREMQFDKLMEAYQNDILRLCYGMLNNMTDAEDALQDTFVKVWKSVYRYQGKTAVLYTPGFTELRSTPVKTISGYGISKGKRTQ